MKNKMMLLLAVGIMVLAGILGFFLVTKHKEALPPLETNEVQQNTVGQNEEPVQAEDIAPSPEAATSSASRTLDEPLPSGVTDVLFPSNATEKVEKEVDFQGDKKLEKVLFYKSKDNLGNNKFRTNQHIQIFAEQKSEWKMVKDDLVPNDNAGVETVIIAKPEVIDLGGDGKEELFVIKCEGKHCSSKYYIFAFVDGQFQDLPIPKGYLHSEEYLQPGDTFLSLTSLKADEQGIHEGYDVYCEAKPYGEIQFGTDEAICRHFELFLHYENGNFRVEKLTEKKT